MTLNPIPSVHSRVFAVHCRMAAMLLLCSVATLAQAGPVLDRIRSTGVVTLGYRPGGAPFGYEDTDGKIVGYAMDVCQRMAAAIQQQLKLPKIDVRYAPVSAADRIGKVKDGTIDFECAGSTNTKARREQVGFGLTYYYAAARLLVRDGESIKSLDDLKTGKTLAVSKGTTAQQIAETRLRSGSHFKLDVLDGTKACVEAVEQGKADAALNDDIAWFPYVRQSKQKLAVIGPNMSIEPLSIMFNGSDADLKTLVQAEMARMYREGAMEQGYNKWFRGPLPNRGYNLDIKINPILLDNFRRPSTYVTDWVVL